MEIVFVMLCPDCHRKQHTNSQLFMRDNEATWRGRDLLLTAAEMRILHLLVSNAGSYMSYRQIYDVVKAPGFHAGAGVDGYKINTRGLIKRIRRKFEFIDPKFNSIICGTAYGYTWREEIPSSEELINDKHQTRRSGVRDFPPVVSGQVGAVEGADREDRGDG